VQEQILDGWEEGNKLIVDVGAGKGHDLVAFKKKYPKEKGLVLQDLGMVVGQLKEGEDGLEGIELQSYDFFTEQPVVGIFFVALFVSINLTVQQVQEYISITTFSMIGPTNTVSKFSRRYPKL
jgi:hypothetical protein